MPTYVHHCKACDQTVEEYRRLADHAQCPECPVCGQPMPKVFLPTAGRASFKRPAVLESLGFPADPQDVAEHRRRFPDIDLRFQDGHAIPVCTSLSQKRRYLDARGMVDVKDFR